MRVTRHDVYANRARGDGIWHFWIVELSHQKSNILLCSTIRSHELLCAGRGCAWRLPHRHYCNVSDMLRGVSVLWSHWNLLLRCFRLHGLRFRRQNECRLPSRRRMKVRKYPFHFIPRVLVGYEWHGRSAKKTPNNYTLRTWCFSHSFACECSARMQTNTHPKTATNCSSVNKQVVERLSRNAMRKGKKWKERGEQWKGVRIWCKTHKHKSFS